MRACTYEGTHGSSPEAPLDQLPARTNRCGDSAAPGGHHNCPVSNLKPSSSHRASATGSRR
eukprot:3500400-Pyramimonas_sp.AAC.1